jgi:hypothetical protein
MTVLPEFHDQLQAAARRQAGRRLPRPGIALRGSLGTIILTTLSAGVVAAVAVVLSTAVRAGPGTTPSAKARSSVASSRAALLQTLAVLRTPQTAADRRSLPSGFLGIQSGRHAGRVVNNSNYQRFLRDRGYPQVDRSLVRVAGVASGGALTFVPMTFRQTTPHRHGIGKLVTFTLHGPRVEGLALSLRLPGTDRVDVSPSTVGALRAEGVNLFTYADHENAGVVVVPDGVTEVRLSRFRVTSRVHVDPTLIPAVTAPVYDNIALFHVAAPTVVTQGGLPGEGGAGMYSTDAHAQMSWVGPQGQVVEHAEIDIAFNFIVRTYR